MLYLPSMENLNLMNKKQNQKNFQLSSPSIILQNKGNFNGNKS